MPAAVARRAEKTRAALRGQVTQLVAWGVEQRGGPAGLDNELMAHFLLSTGEDAGRLVLSDPERFPPVAAGGQPRGRARGAEAQASLRFRRWPVPTS